MDEQLFANGPAQPAAHAAPAVPPAVAGQLASLATRIKLVEDRYNNLGKRSQITESSLLEFEKEIKTELRVLTKQTVELRKRLSEMNAKLDAMQGELGTVVQKHEFSVLERYLDLWQPLQFVTRDEARRIIEGLRQEMAQRGPDAKDGRGGIGDEVVR